MFFVVIIYLNNLFTIFNMTTRTYNPATGTKVGFFNKFVARYPNWRDYGFCLPDFSHSKTPDFEGKEEVEVLGMNLDDYLGKVRVARYSQTLEYTERKKKKVGSVHIIALEKRDARRMVGQLERITGIKLRMISEE